MKKTKLAPLFFALCACVLLALCVSGLANGGKAAHAYTGDPYKFDVAEYNVIYDIKSDCSVSVTEELTINYMGYSSTGFIRDIPVNGGAQVKNVRVKRLIGGAETSVYNRVFMETNGFVSVDIGDNSLKTGKSETYRLTYVYNVTNKVVKKGMLPLNPIGHGWDCEIHRADIKLILPDGFTSAKCYVGEKGSTAQTNFNEATENGRKVLTLSVNGLDRYCGVTFDLSFEKGAIKNYFEFTPYWFVISGAVIIAAAALLKLFLFNKNGIIPVTNYTAPDKMNPLLMGKLIDGKVDNEDITSLIYYWANKGYLKINLDDKNNPTLIRVMQALPEGTPVYEQTLFYGLFEGRDTVTPAQLKNKFYVTVKRATAQVNAETKGLYSIPSVATSIALAAAGALLTCFAPPILALSGISLSFIYFPSLFAAVPLALIYIFETGLICAGHKLSKGKIALFAALLAAGGAVTVLLYTLLIPSAILPVTAKLLISLTGVGTVAAAAIIISRTKSYTEKLNDILGFKSFISLVEKPQIEKLLEEDPQFYYSVLPYAQVLGVTKLWEDKFASITVTPPNWVTGDALTTVIEIHVLNSIINSSVRNIAGNMVSRPSSSGSNGFGGGFGGGFSGGGFGGGGGRGR